MRAFQVGDIVSHVLYRLGERAVVIEGLRRGMITTNWGVDVPANWMLIIPKSIETQEELSELLERQYGT